MRVYGTPSQPVAARDRSMERERCAREQQRSEAALDLSEAVGLLCLSARKGEVEHGGTESRAPV